MLSVSAGVIYLFCNVFTGSFNRKKAPNMFFMKFEALKIVDEDVWMQDYGHRVRLATHANFKEFVLTAGLEFYPLGGDPKILAECM